MDLAADEGREDALFAARLYHGALTGSQANSERRVPVAAISRLGPPSRRRDHKIGKEETEGVSEEAPLKLPPVEQQDDLTRAFEALKVTCEELETTKAHWRDWMSDSTWLLIKQRTSLRRAGQLRQLEGRRMQRAIHAALKRDRAARTAQVGESIVAKLAEGNVHEAFRHLKGWYREASETQARPCFQTMERQTVERVELYLAARLAWPPHHRRPRRDAYRNPG